MKSILEILAVGATLAALATAANAGTNDAKVNVGTAAPSVAAPVCTVATAAVPANAGTGAAAKPACTPTATTSGKPAPAHH
jgi:hypothetical protein